MTTQGGIPPGAGPFGVLLQALPRQQADDLAAILRTLVRSNGWVEAARVYLSDYPERRLLWLAGSASGGHTHEIGSTPAGRAFRLQGVVRVDRSDGSAGERWWVPLTNRWRRLGVLEFECLPDTSADPPGARSASLDARSEAALQWAALVATVIDSASRCTDAFVTAKRGARLSLTAEMQWELLPPLCVAGDTVTLAGRLEPAYEVGGDAFDYAVTGARAHLAVFDPVGHDLRSALLAALAVGCYRHGRRGDRPLAELGPEIDAAVHAQYPDGGFVTGQLATLHQRTGRLTLANAGHPAPLLLRGRTVRRIDLPVDPPWGLGHRLSTTTEVDLEPGDHVLFYTDGLVDARSPAGEFFGLPRLSDLLVREAHGEHAPPELLRRLLDALGEHRGGPLQDDATAVILHWRGPGEPPDLGG